MAFKPNFLPLPERGVLHPVHITKVISMKKICFRLLDKKDDYVLLIKDLHRYYTGKTAAFIDSVPEDSVEGCLFLLKRQDLFHRVTVINAWPNKTYHVKLIDEGFEFIAREKDLILNSNNEFLKYPSQAFILPLQIDQFLVKKKAFMLNYGLQKLANSKVDFFVVITNDDKLQLYFKDQSQNMVFVNDFLTQYIKKSMYSKMDKPVITVIEEKKENIETYTGKKTFFNSFRFEIPKFY